MQSKKRDYRQLGNLRIYLGRWKGGREWYCKGTGKGYEILGLHGMTKD